MRRLFLSVLGLSWLGLVGCHHVCSHGVCDCQADDHCCTRSPWVQFAPTTGLGTPVVPVEALPVAPFKGTPRGGLE